jgi:hypothetical protein
MQTVTLSTGRKIAVSLLRPWPAAQGRRNKDGKLTKDVGHTLRITFDAAFTFNFGAMASTDASLDDDEAHAKLEAALMSAIASNDLGKLERLTRLSIFSADPAAVLGEANYLREYFAKRSAAQ